MNDWLFSWSYGLRRLDETLNRRWYLRTVPLIFGFSMIAAIILTFYAFRSVSDCDAMTMSLGADAAESCAIKRIEDMFSIVMVLGFFIALFIVLRIMIASFAIQPMADQHINALQTKAGKGEGVAAFALHIIAYKKGAHAESNAWLEEAVKLGSMRAARRAVTRKIGWSIIDTVGNLFRRK